MAVPLSVGAARYRYVVTIEKRAGTRDAGEVVNTWTTFATARAGFEPVRGREFFAAGRIDAETTHVVYMRHLAGLDETMRINWNGRIFDIQAIINVDERNRELEITAIERKKQ